MTTTDVIYGAIDGDDWKEPSLRERQMLNRLRKKVGLSILPMDQDMSKKMYKNSVTLLLRKIEGKNQKLVSNT